jgi:dihydropyrimidinase
MRVLVSGGHIVTASQRYSADVLIHDEKIEAVGSFDPEDADEVIDAKGRLVLPGGVDPHTHLDAPLKGTITADDFLSGTIAAAVGGTTTIIDFPVQTRGEDPRASHEAWYARAEGKAVVDWGLHQVISDLPEAYLPAIDDLIDRGVSSFKLFMAYPGTRMVDDGTLMMAMRRTAERGGLILLHAENGMAIDVLEREARSQGISGPIGNKLTRPPATEAEATSRAIRLSELVGAPIYVVHLCASEALAEIRAARGRGLPVYAETCPHYLLLTEAKLSEPGFEGAKYVMCPPLRSEENQEALWLGLATGDIQVVATDHTPFRFADQKILGQDDFAKIPNGVPGIEWRTCLMYHFGVGQGRFSINRLVELLAANPAKLFGLYPRKGEIAPGSDADIVLVAPERQVHYSAAAQATTSDYNPYEGWNTVGAVETVLLRGEVIVSNGRFVGRKGQGRFLRRGPPMLPQ